MRESFEEYNLYSVYDEVDEAFGMIFLSPSDEAAKRLCSKGYAKSSDLGDLVLYHVGVMDVSTGLVEGVRPVRRVISLAALFVPPEEVSGNAKS